ncbi:MAG: site-specific DNA-methyltransferase [Oscillospiraceae bacterium]|nr:site-specific DNA-methyltransferase [Oscillospiraceae bacterium]
MANLSQQKRERMLAFLEMLKSQHTDDDSLIALGEIEKELKAKKYGLVWEEHEEAVDVMMRTHIPVFTADESMEINGDPNSEQYNFLLEGDNLHSLRLLEKTHSGRIDLIYIDPPYNTGNKEFIYDDTMIGDDDTYKHSKWISFMRSRLQMAWKLLSNAGAIFISIDDREQANLKLLCDELFGESCFLADVIWQHSLQANGYGGKFVSQFNHTLVYAKPQFILKNLPRTDKDNKMYRNPDNDPRGPWRAGYCVNGLYRPNLVYEVIAPNGNIIAPPEKGWRWSKETMQSKIDSGEIIFNADQTNIIHKLYLSDLDGKVPENIWVGGVAGTTRQATAELKDIFGGKAPFDTPKPTELIKRIIHIASNPNSIVLDFFAGSGTTAHAVLAQNAEDGGKRKFILCTNNENNICEGVTYQRIKTVITGKRQDGSEYSEGIPANLMYFRTDFVEKESEELSENLLEHIREMIQLEHGVKIDDQKYVIIMTDEEMDAFEQNIGNYPDLCAVFINQDVFLSSSQEALLEKIDSYIIPDYYFDFELREAGEIW